MRWGGGDDAWQRWGPLALVVFSLVLPLCIARSQLLTGDPTYYMGLARSLAAGDGYTLMGQPHTTYPPGLPLLLTPVAALAGPDVRLMQLVVALFGPVSLLAVLAFLRTEEPGSQLPIGAVLVLGVPFFALATQGVRTELPFLAASALALRMVWSPPAKAREIWPLSAVAALTAATVLLRTIGVALPLALLIAWGHRRIRRLPAEWTDRALLAGAAGGLLAAAGWFAWISAHQTGSYVDLMLLTDPHEPDLGPATVATMLGRIPVALRIQITHVAEAITAAPRMLSTWLSPVVVLVTASLLLGVWRELRRPNPALGWYVLGYGGILLLWPFDEGVRFILPILPFLLLIGWRGAAWALTRLPRSAWLGIAGLALASVAVMLLLVQNFPLRSRQGMVLLVAWLVLAAAALYRWRRGGPVFPREWGRRAVLLALSGYAALSLVRTVPAAVRQLRGKESGAVELRSAMEWLRGRAAPNQVVMAQPASAVYFYTGLRSTRLPVTRNPGTLMSALRESRPAYLLILDTAAHPYYRPTEVERLAILQAAAGPDAFQSVFRFSAGTIYEVHLP